MKLSILVSSIFIIFSCSKETISEKNFLSDTQINSMCKELFSKYITIENNSLVLSVNEQYLLENGYDKEAIDLFHENISKANSYISNYIVETKSDTEDIDIELSDEIDIPTSHDIVIEMPHGMLDTTNGETVAEDYFFAPFSMVGVNCNIISAAPAAVHIVITHAMSNCTQMRVGMGSLYVQLLASNCYATIKYLTTDSNGGKCAWIGVSGGTN